MKNIIIVGDGMADHPVERLGGKTPLQYADTPFMDTIARQGRTGKLTTIPEGFPPGSEVANTTILGYDPGNVYEGRGPLEAAGMGYDMEAADMALRCNIITTDDGKIVSHNGGNINSVIAREIISRLNGGINSDRVRFVEGTLCQHLLVIKGGNKHVSCCPPHEHIGEQMEKIAVTAEEGLEDRRDVFIDVDGRKHERMTSRQTSRLLNETIRKSQDILKDLSHGKGKIQYMAVERRLSPGHATTVGNPPADKVGMRDKRGQPRAWNRPSRRSRHHKSEGGDRSCRHKL